VGSVLAAVVAFCPNDSFADPVALAIGDSNRGEDAEADASLGWQFTVNSPIVVTQLGVWDGLRRYGSGGTQPTTAGGGLGEDHTVTIWDGQGNPLAQATVPAGTSSELVGVFRYVALPSPIMLEPGIYAIGAYYKGDTPTLDGAAFATTVAAAPELSYDASMLWFGSGPPGPNSTGDASGYFGPNFRFQQAAPAPTPTPTPEPAAATPLISPAGGTFKKKASFKITCATPGAVIYYTTDGTDPTTSSPVFPGPIGKRKKVRPVAISGKGDHIVRAFASAAGFSDSDVATATFTLLK
jgi:hypothetical protein